MDAAASSSSRNPWTTRNDPARQGLAGAAAAAVGALLMAGFRAFEGPGLSNSRAGFLLGVLCLGLGLASLLLRSTRTITVDPGRRRIVIEDRHRFGGSRQVIAFADIADLSIGSLGERGNGSVSYHVAARLKSGREVALFFPFFAGAGDRAAMEERRRRLQGYLDGGPP